MAEDFIKISGTKEEQYRQLEPMLTSLLAGENNLIANQGNLCAALKTQFDWLWVGFYMIEVDQLVLGPFQGPIACTRINKGKGVCGSAWSEQKTIIVPNVDLFPGHIACSSMSKSEIVIPFYQGDALVGVLDIDSQELNSFDEVDARFLSSLLEKL